MQTIAKATGTKWRGLDRRVYQSHARDRADGGGVCVQVRSTEYEYGVQVD